VLNMDSNGTLWSVSPRASLQYSTRKMALSKVMLIANILHLY